ncbi:HIT domain-containing protein [Wolbachia endosymbiont of Dirofilaria (Dirofilaria) immitis]|uniref:HIT domain-containing protein n=1 Tax=Wolbachia endosymbiont of Dirofilaria (Dirofilaria) immitis TaxID=1812115 RepID=UPI001589952D|nr:HIT domain-containing protein [Wolbachia endosymbiont of Dirofilaria (Dirofilaria) immitis]QKX02409.1 HIT domain-containing protein [Wolbachia endosymbiont of Dirofilaria (Dirofilaria) immitis]
MSNKGYDSSNVFAQILRGELPCKKVYEDEDVLAFYDKYPDAPVHILVVPRDQYVSYDDFILKASAEKIVGFFKAIREVIYKYNLEETGYRLVTNYGKNGEQVVPHFHVHVLGGKRLGKHVNL